MKNPMTRILCGGIVSERRSPFARFSPLPKVCFVLGFLVLTVSFGRYEWIGTTLFALVPFLFARIGDVPPGGLLARAALALPFVLCAGAANLLFDREPVCVTDGVFLPGGVLAFWVLAAKTLAATGMVLLLAATTSISGISGALVRLHVPCILILQIQLLCRYLVLTAEEAGNLSHAYFLRNPGCRILPARDWGDDLRPIFFCEAWNGRKGSTARCSAVCSMPGERLPARARRERRSNGESACCCLPFSAR